MKIPALKFKQHARAIGRFAWVHNSSNRAWDIYTGSPLRDVGTIHYVTETMVAFGTAKADHVDKWRVTFYFTDGRRRYLVGAFDTAEDAQSAASSWFAANYEKIIGKRA